MDLGPVIRIIENVPAALPAEREPKPCGGLSRPPDAKRRFEEGDGTRHNGAASVLIVSTPSPRSSSSVLRST